MGPESTELNPKHSNKHHVIPKSRLPRKYRVGKDNKLANKRLVIKVFSTAHVHFHNIFGNRTPDEQIKHLRDMCHEDGALYAKFYFAYRSSFDSVFNCPLYFNCMVEVLKRWDFPESAKVSDAEKIAELMQIINDNIKGGIVLKD